jgi:hypothetical protein
MATETTKTDKTEETGAAPETALDKDTEGKAGEAADGTAADDARAETLSDDDYADDGYADEDTARAGASRGLGGAGAGAAAVVSAGLGLSSITGTSLSEMLRDRKQLIGQIESQAQGPQGGGGGADQITALYGAPWHATALLNGIFALLAVLVGGVLLALVAKRAETRSWVKAVALGGLVLGGIGLLVAGGMYLDLFAAAPEMPSAPPGPPAQ